MGKKKKDRKRKAAEAALRADKGGTSPLTVLQGLGDALLDQLRSPAGRQVVAAALIAAAGAISRGGPTARTAATPEPDDPEASTSSTPPPFPAEMTKIAGVALTAFDNWLSHKTRS